ncbi:MAG: hypothetical protein Q9M09_00135 [Mariprofundaceae bacterium]|nr:hypothetical protein [Mariprofundaceae bacterium]
MIKNIIIIFLLGVIAWLVWLIETDDSRYDPTKQSIKDKMHETVKETGEKTLHGLQKTGEAISETSQKMLDETTEGSNAPQGAPQ